MKKDELLSQKPNIEKLIEQLEKNLDKRLAEEKQKPKK